MWIIAEYEATALFSLKPASATASGGRTLLVPTPFAIKMALLDSACRLEGVQAGETAWGWIRSLRVALRPPEQVVVNNTFIKILKPRRNPAEPGSQDAGFFGKTISYREFAYYHNTFRLALEFGDEAYIDPLARWLIHVNYLGKRGSFVQVQDVPHVIDRLDADYIQLSEDMVDFGVGTTLTQLDDAAADVTFEQVNIYSGKSLRLNKDRLLRHVALPYQMIRSSRGYTHYRLMEVAE